MASQTDALIPGMVAVIDDRIAGNLVRAIEANGTVTGRHVAVIWRDAGGDVLVAGSGLNFCEGCLQAALALALLIC